MCSCDTLVQEGGGSSGGRAAAAGWLLAGSLVTSPAPHGGNRRLQAAAASGGRVGARETRLQRGEHRLAAGLRCVVGGVAQVFVRQRQLGDGPPCLGVLQQER